MEVSVQLSCPCKPEFVYKNQHSLTQHKKTKVHKMWEQTQENRTDKIRSKEFENEIERLRNRLVHKEEVERELLCRIRQIEQERDYWRAASDGIFL
jgi:ribosomal protein S30